MKPSEYPIFTADLTYDKSMGGSDDRPDEIRSMFSVVCDCGYESEHHTPKAAMSAGNRHCGDHALGRRGFEVGTGMLSHPVGW